MKYIIFLFIATSMTVSLGAQKHFTRSGMITFSSDAPMEKIEATNSKASSVMDIESGAIEWAVLIKAFEFKKALMQEHFNENYMESSKFPKATFKGVVNDIDDIDFQVDGNHQVSVTGSLVIHGVTNEINTNATISITKGQISATSELVVLVADYNIEIPKVVKENIAKEVSIAISVDYQLLKR